MTPFLRVPCASDDKLGAAPVSALERGEIELAHLQQRLHDFRGVPLFRVGQHLAQRGRNDLPRHAEAILEPAARSWFATVCEPRPEFADLLLGLAGRHERKGFGERKRLSAVKGGVLLPVDEEAGVQYAAFRNWTLTVAPEQAQDPGILEQRNVKINGLLGPALERQRRSDTLNLRLGSNGRSPGTGLTHFRSSLCLGRVLRRSSSAANLSSRDSHIAR